MGRFPAFPLNQRLQRAGRALMALALLLTVLPESIQAQGDFSLRFYGTGRDGVDRVTIPLDAPPRPVDVGGDFTIEFWLKALPGDNTASACSPGGDNWIYGNVVIDRDVYFAGDYGDYGISLADGRVAFGVNNGSEGTTLCGQTDVTDGRWHHIALTRSAADGSLAIFIDGRLDVRGNGPTGDVSYRDGRATQYPADPFLVIGAEKHDAGPEYPSFRGWIDEVRISRIIRYRGAFTPPTAPFTPDPDTVALYHFNEGAGVTVRDSSGAPDGPSDGALRVGGSPAGPAWSEDTPWISSSASPTSPTSLPSQSTPALSPQPSLTTIIAVVTNVPLPTDTPAPPTPPTSAASPPTPTPISLPSPALPTAGAVAPSPTPGATLPTPPNPPYWLLLIAVAGLALAGVGVALMRRR
ncbi:LamG-like jellyroll fold domain-containing protein [Roseiflexus sp.]